MSRLETIPQIDVDDATKDLLNQILRAGNNPSDDLLRRLIPSRREFERFCKDHALSNSGPAKEVMARLDALGAKAKARASSRPLTRAALVRQMAEKLSWQTRMASAFFDILAETAIRETRKNGVFVIPGIGMLKRTHRKARAGRNPQTGEPVKIKAGNIVVLRVAKKTAQAITERKGTRSTE
jgi:DNA-binding protein HU-beta